MSSCAISAVFILIWFVFVVEDTSVVTARKRGRPLKHPASISSSAGQTHDSSIMKRKRGRPKGNLDNSGRITLYLITFVFV